MCAMITLIVIVYILQTRDREGFIGEEAADVDWDSVCMRLNETGGPEAFSGAFGAAGNPTCMRLNSAQAGYDYNNCRLTSMMMSSVIGDVPYLEQAKAYCGARGDRTRDLYVDLLKKAINYDTVSYSVYDKLNVTAPANYTFVMPEPLDDTDYAPTLVKQWVQAASGAAVRSYKCVPFTGEERAVLDYFKGRLLGNDAVNRELRDAAAHGICASKGYTRAVKGVTLGCEMCDGCCVASSEALVDAGAVAGSGGGAGTGAAKCPPPAVRPFVIKKGATKVVRTPPTGVECFVGGVAGEMAGKMPGKLDNIKIVKQIADMRKLESLRNIR